jgi:hypothetical protein
MRRIGVLVCLVLAGGVAAAGAMASPADDAVHLEPASTSVDHAPFCTVPASTLTATPTAGGTLVTFTLLPPGCD